MKNALRYDPVTAWQRTAPKTYRNEHNITVRFRREWGLWEVLGGQSDGYTYRSLWEAQYEVECRLGLLYPLQEQQ